MSHGIISTRKEAYFADQNGIHSHKTPPDYKITRGATLSWAFRTNEPLLNKLKRVINEIIIISYTHENVEKDLHRRRWTSHHKFE